ncbi:MAG TPA: phosphoribosylanthranilate isomerase [Drouetiella sp.]
MSTGVKICGITNAQDARDAIAAGAEFLGFIFVQSSDRAVDESGAKAILPEVRGKAKIVGVFRNSAIEEVNRLASLLNFDFVQLHGNESPEYCSEVNAPVIKVIEITADADLDSLRANLGRYSKASYILFDKPKGLDFDQWLDFAVEKVAAIPSIGEYFFAGGLNHTNVKGVLARISPTFVDVASGVEKAPGVKDVTKMNAFCNAVKNKKVVPEEAMS